AAPVIAGSTHGPSAAHPKHSLVLGAVIALPTATDPRRTLPGLRLRPPRLDPDSEPGRNPARRRPDGPRARRRAAHPGSRPRGLPSRARPRYVLHFHRRGDGTAQLGRPVEGFAPDLLARARSAGPARRQRQPARADPAGR